MPSTSSITFHLDITPEEYLSYYNGAVKYVFTYAVDGRSVRFPAGLLRRFVGRDGIHGTFEILFDKEGKLQEMRRLS
jgi:hypothetical protein